MRQRLRRQSGKTLAKERAGGRAHLARDRLTMHELDDLEGEHPLPATPLRMLSLLPLDARDLAERQEGEDTQVARDVAVVHVDEVLVELVGRREGRVEPERVALALAKLRARGRRDQRDGQRVNALAAHAADEIHPGG